jgi:hypothetical protein
MAQPSGGGLSNKGTATIINVTVYENSSVGGTGGISNTGTLNLSNSIVAHKTATGVDCSGVNAGAFNLASDSSCQAAIVGDPLLGPLQLNGGSTKTHAPGNGSPALDVGNNAVCAAPPINNVDQRGVKRPFGSTCDLGAQEDGSGTYIYLPLVFK